jgi:DNA-binding IclR family transcriptional regulator
VDVLSTSWKEGSGTRSIERFLRVLHAIADEPQGAAELSRKLDLPRPTLARFTSLLEKHRYVTRTEGGLYRLGTRPIELSARWREQTRLPELCDPYLRALVNRFQETARVCVRDGLESLCVSGLESPRAIRFSLTLGARTALHAGGFNKTLLTFAPQSVIDAVLSAPLIAFTRSTITDPQILAEELETIRRRGYGESHGEMDEGVFAVAAPIRDASGAVEAVIGVAGVDSRLTPALLKALREEAIAAAGSISAELGARNEGSKQGGALA